VQPIDCGIPIAAPAAIERVKGTAKKPVLVGFEKLLCPELVDIENILGGGVREFG
jgi:hypothetical protein